MRAIIQEKKKRVDELKKKIDSSSLMILTNFQGVGVVETSLFRKQLLSCGAEYKVVKNTLFQKAVGGSNLEELNRWSVGNTGLLLGYEDPLHPLKILVKFIKDLEKGEIKVGVVEKKVLSEKELQQLAKLPSREVLLTKMVFGFQAPLYGLAAVLEGLMRKLVYALSAIKERRDINGKS